MTDLTTINIQGVYTDDGRGTKHLTALFTEKKDAENEAKRLEREGAFVLPVKVFAPKEGGWRRMFRQREGRSE